MIVLDLCGGTGSWSAPYREAGYDVRLVDLPDDVRLFEYPGPVHGILAAPPCTYFCRMRMCRGTPTPEQFREGLSIVDGCLRVIQVCKPRWWALENPQGYLHRWLGPPAMKFHPWQYGDPWTKRTWIWGRFVVPHFTRTQPLARKVGNKRGDRALLNTPVENSRTPPGFARAFFEANP